MDELQYSDYHTFAFLSFYVITTSALKLCYHKDLFYRFDLFSWCVHI